MGDGRGERGRLAIANISFYWYFKHKLWLPFEHRNVNICAISAHLVGHATLRRTASFSTNCCVGQTLAVHRMCICQTRMDQSWCWVGEYESAANVLHSAFQFYGKCSTVVACQWSLVEVMQWLCRAVSFVYTQTKRLNELCVCVCGAMCCVSFCIHSTRRIYSRR